MDHLPDSSHQQAALLNKSLRFREEARKASSGDVSGAGAGAGAWLPSRPSLTRQETINKPHPPHLAGMVGHDSYISTGGGVSLEAQDSIASLLVAPCLTHQESVSSGPSSTPSPQPPGVRQTLPQAQAQQRHQKPGKVRLFKKKA